MSQSSDSSFSLSPTLLPENNKKIEDANKGPMSDTSSISECISSGNESVENDRSFQEIEVSNVPSSFSIMLQNLPSDDDLDRLSQEIKPPSLSTPSFISNNFSILNINMENIYQDSSNNVKSILDEILHKDDFKSVSEHTISTNSNDTSLNIFEGINLDDNSINNYVAKLKGTEFELNLTEGDVSASDTPKVTACHHSKSEISGNKIKDYEDLLSTKDITIAALNAELDSLREIASNPSTLSLNTTTTEYKQYQDEYKSRVSCINLFFIKQIA